MERLDLSSPIESEGICVNRHSKFVASAALLALAPLGVVLLPAKGNPLATRGFQFEYVLRIPEVPQGAEKLRVWLPVPQSDADQVISALVVESPVPYELHREREYGNRYLYLEAAPRSLPKPLEVRLRFNVKRSEHKVSLQVPVGSRGAVAADRAERARSLRADRLVPIDGLIAQLSEQETRGLTKPLDKARAVYNYVVSTMRYDKSGEGWGRGDALYACNVRKGNCTDFHALLIGMLRAAGIPARFEIGFPLPPGQTSGQIPGYHCWAQFYLDGVGWVPVDASEAWKNPAQREYFFGAHDPHRVLFTRGRDIRFNPAQQGEALNYFIYPYAELDGKPFDGAKHQFFFRDLGKAKR